METGLTRFTKRRTSTLKRLARRRFLLAAAAIAAGTAVTATRARARIEDAETTHPPLGDFVVIDGVNVHYVQKGTGPHLVLLHGAGGNLREFTFDMFDQLTDRYTVTAFDRPGLGFTDRLPDVSGSAFATEGESPQAQAALLRKAAENIGVTDPIVAGHSFGGVVAMAWAVAGLDEQSQVNAKAVMLMAGVCMPWPGALGSYYTVNGSALGGAILPPLIAAYASDQRVVSTIDGIFAPNPVPEGYTDYIGANLAIRPTTFRANVRQVNTLRPHVVEMAKRYPKLDLPIEIVHGDADTTVPINVHSNELAKIVPSVTVTTLSGAGHMPHHADREATLAAIDRAASRAGLL